MKILLQEVQTRGSCIHLTMVVKTFILRQETQNNSEWNWDSQTIFAGNGNVGLGISDPKSKLHANGGAIFDHQGVDFTAIRIGHHANNQIFADDSPSQYYEGDCFLEYTTLPLLITIGMH